MLDPIGDLIRYQANSSFGIPPSSVLSRAPTQHYDRTSRVLVLDEEDEVLKFLKMHLNRFFSKISVHRSGTDAYKAIKEAEFDLVVAPGAPAKKSTSDFLKKLAAHYRHIPVVLTRNDSSPPFTSGDYPRLLAVSIVEKPFDMDTLHVAIRRGMNMRGFLKELSPLLDAEVAIGKLVRTAVITDKKDRRQALVEEIRRCLTEEIPVD